MGRIFYGFLGIRRKAVMKVVTFVAAND